MKKKEIEQILNTYYTDKSLNKSVASELFDLYVVSQRSKPLGCNVKNCYRKGDKHKNGYIYCDRHKPKA
jgi:hypothetical protein